MQKQHTLSALFLSIVITCTFCHVHAQQANLQKIKAAIAQSHTLYSKAFSTGDSSLLINRYTYDCWIMQQNTPTLCGVNAPLDFFKSAYSTGIRKGKFTITELFGDGKDFVTEAGQYQLYGAANNVLDNGKYLILWKKENGEWKMFRNSFNSNGKETTKGI